MTPTETFANSRLDAENLIRQYAPARLQGAVIERLLPAIALAATRTDDAEIASGASNFGGAPDVAAGFEWLTSIFRAKMRAALSVEEVQA